jgi:hypothetical protein
MGNGDSRGRTIQNDRRGYGFSESGIAENTNVPFGTIPNGNFVIVDSFRTNSQLPDIPIFNYINRFNVPRVVHAVLPLDPVLYMWDASQNKYRFWFSMRFTGNGKAASCTLRRTHNPLRILLSTQRDSPTLNVQGNNRVWYGGNGYRLYRRKNDLSTSRWSEYCNEALWPGTRTTRYACRNQTFSPTQNFTCNNAQFGGAPTYGIPNYCWLDSNQFTFMEVLDPINCTVQGVNELMLNRREGVPNSGNVLY